MVAVFLVTMVATPMIAGAATPAGTEILNSATATYEDVNSNNFSAVSNTTTVTVTSVFSVSITNPADLDAYIDNTVYYPYTLTNAGNDNNTFTLSGSSASGWTVTLYVDTNGDGTHQSTETTTTASTGVVAPDNTYKFFMAVTVPNNTSIPNNTTDVATLTVTGTGNAGAADDTSDTVTTTVRKPFLVVTKNVSNITTGGGFDNTASAAPGQTLEYRIQVVNSGSIAASAVVLTDSDNANTTYVANSMRIGPDNAYGSANNLNPGDGNSDSAFPMPCVAAACGHGNVTSGNITAYLGNGANDGAAGPGGTLSAGQTIYVFFRVTVD